MPTLKQPVPGPTIKLQAAMAQLGVASRRKSEELIAAGKVLVNQKPAHIGQRIDLARDQISVNGKTITMAQPPELVYFLVNKPVGYVSTTSDEQGRKTVLDLLPKSVTTQYRLFPVGRLDLDSQGLILLTNDGELAQQLTHPSFRHQKTYEVLVQGTPSRKAIDHLRRGVKLKEGYSKPDSFEVIGPDGDNTWLELTLHEGRNHQVRRMMERIGYPVLELVRTKMGPFELDMLEEERYIKLSDDEISQISH